MFEHFYIKSDNSGVFNYNYYIIFIKITHYGYGHTNKKTKLFHP